MVAVGMIADRAYSIHELSTCSGDGWWVRKLVEVVSMIVLSKVFFFLTILLPNADPSKGAWADWTYWGVVLFFATFFLAVNVWPLGISCDELASMTEFCNEESIRTANLKKDCTLQGHTACQMLQLWMLVMPYVLPQFDCWSYTFVWLVFIYTGCSWVYDAFSGEMIHEDDLPLHFVLLGVTACLGTMKKYFLEKGLRRQFRIDYEEKKVLEDLYNVFDGMVPSYVIPRMLREDTIADPIDRVTILFVLIVIDDSAHSMDPKKTLADLNQIFGRMDEICAKYQVTKIETVAEEYVACVGVLPKDHGEIGDKAHYDKLLVRMFLAASEILDMENQDFRMGGQKVQLKMGTHTGKIIAGVIGKKLPRFRLFGDTINTSARMMQKSKPGNLMFGEETNQVLPSCIPARKGEKVVMKGKGEVEVYYFDRAGFQAAEAKRLLEEKGTEEPRAKTGEDERQQEVNEVIQQVFDSSEPTGWLLSHKEGFTNDTAELANPNTKMFSEAEFQSSFHCEAFVRKFRSRLHRQVLLMAGATLFDLFHMEHTRAWEVKDKGSGFIPNAKDGGRFQVLLGCRMACLVLALLWSVMAKLRTDWMMENVTLVQWGVVGTSSVVCTLMFVSYDALVFPQITKSYEEMHFLEYLNQQLSLVFVLAFFIVTNTHPTLFVQSLVFLPAGVVFMAIRDKTSLYISNIGRVVFLCTVAISCMLAHELEQTSRARFKAKRRVQRTQERIEYVLNSLMPKAVLEERKSRPGADLSKFCHLYEHATITQSDLCGFTQLAATKTPAEVVDFVADLFGRFDVQTDKYGVYKVETVGDAYIAGMAENTLTTENSVLKVVQFGLAMIEETSAWAAALGVQVTCRVGVHHGECVGGIVGKGMQRYHLFGALMNQVDTLEATSREGITQISKACKEALVRELAKKDVTEEAESMRILVEAFPGAIQRKDEKLTTSKGEEHLYSEVGGGTYLIYKDAAAAAGAGAAPG
ncbi:gcy-14 [Symbiodinium natans]|uniref:Gcy-14 protein n=1 Tax=Symbiodinium natans TaxID=878477 RepID=A0A812KSX6_9DINO|nr:gcy-14 [Symbiodinium natans]